MLPIIGMSQRFDFALTGGLTLAQVNGDQLAGYDKLGFEAGVRTNIIFTDRWDMVVELLYSQRGSASEITFGGSNAAYALQLDYLSIPVLAELKDWEVKGEDTKPYHKVRIAAGLAYGRLFNSSESFGTGIDFGDQDLSMILDLGFHISQHIALALRYTRTVIPLDRVVVGAREVNVIPHHVTLGARYQF